MDLDRFVSAQEGDYEQALAELRDGRKRSHWMWFVFPQLRGLGIERREEAAAYLAHPVLGPRLVACAEALLETEGRTAREILGSPDDLKLRSCATLFAEVAPAGSVFERLLDKYFEGQADPVTLRLLGKPGKDIPDA